MLALRWTQREKLVRNAESQFRGPTGSTVTLNPNLPTYFH
jgi:phage protein U